VVANRIIDSGRRFIDFSFELVLAFSARLL